MINYTDGKSYDKKEPYPNCNIGFGFINKTDQMICLKMEDIIVNDVEHIIEENDWTVTTFVALPQEMTLIELNVYKTVQNANMTELEDVEMTFKVYAYNSQDGSIGEEMGSKTVKFAPK